MFFVFMRTECVKTSLYDATQINSKRIRSFFFKQVVVMQSELAFHAHITAQVDLERKRKKETLM